MKAKIKFGKDGNKVYAEVRVKTSDVSSFSGTGRSAKTEKQALRNLVEDLALAYASETTRDMRSVREESPADVPEPVAQS